MARLTELAGYMAVDTGQPGLAQRYYIQALRLAQAAGDRAYGGYVLAASMSHLAAELGNPREIAQLARAAQEGTRGQVTPRVEAMFYAAEARGHALLGDTRATAVLSGRAVSALERAEPESGDDPAWIRHFDEAYLADELAHCHRDLGQAEEAGLRAEEALRGSRRARRGAGPSGCCCWRRRRCSSGRWNRPARRPRRRRNCWRGSARTGGRSIWTTSGRGWSRTGRRRPCGSSGRGSRPGPPDRRAEARGPDA